MISVVTPWRTLLSAFGLIGKVKSEWVLMSMKPGATARPGASMIFSAGASIAADRGDAAVLDGEIGGDARAPLPSNSSPPRIRMSCTG